MKTKILLAAISALALCSCNYLDKLPDGDMTVEEAFSNYQLADRYLANTYFHLPNETLVADRGPSQRSPWMGASDEMEITFGDCFSHLMNNGGWNAVNTEDGVRMWSENYMGIRKVNQYLENIHRVPVSADGISFTEETRRQRTGEGYFLRAFFHFHLIRIYGPIVLLDHSLPTDMNISDYKRAPYSECVQFILDDLARAEELLPMSYDDATFGRATVAAVLALRSRLLLYAASPLFNGNPDYAGFTDNDGVNLFPGQYDVSLWADAADAALDAITRLEASGYGLYEKNADPVKNFANIFQDSGSRDDNNPEWIFWRNIGDNVHGLDRCANPLSSSGFSILSVTQEMVDAYEMADGQTPITGYAADGKTPVINTASGYLDAGYTDSASPEGYWPAGVHNRYTGREPRFYACINFPGQIWKTKPVTLWNKGADGKGVAGSDFCSTGYLLRKFAHEETLYPSNQGVYNNHSHFFRFGELYLNYAEAVNEAEGPAKAYPYVNRIRQRAGLPALPDGLNQAQMRERIHHERRIELAFENHRFFDVRRWKIAPETDNKPIHGLDIYAGEHSQDDAFYVRTQIEPRVFQRQHYLFPISQTDVNRSERILVQNPWW